MHHILDGFISIELMYLNLGSQSQWRIFTLQTPTPLLMSIACCALKWNWLISPQLWGAGWTSILLAAFKPEGNHKISALKPFDAEKLDLRKKVPCSITFYLLTHFKILLIYQDFGKTFLNVIFIQPRYTNGVQSMGLNVSETVTPVIKN